MPWSFNGRLITWDGPLDSNQDRHKIVYIDNGETVIIPGTILRAGLRYVLQRETKFIVNDPIITTEF